MLQVWKLEIPVDGTDGFKGWALAQTADEALALSGVKSAIVKRMPDHLWISPRRRIIWEY